MPFESSSLPGAGPIFPDWTFENWPSYHVRDTGACERNIPFLRAGALQSRSRNYSQRREVRDCKGGQTAQMPEGENISRWFLDFSARAGLNVSPCEISLRSEAGSPKYLRGPRYVSMYVCMYVCIYIYIYMYVCMYVCMCVYAYIYIYMYIYLSIYIYILRSKMVLRSLQPPPRSAHRVPPMVLILIAINNNSY